MTHKKTIPTAERPGMVEYGISSAPEGMLTWAWVEEQMAKSRNYWICTVSPQGKPHAAPVWGVWYDSTLYFGSGLKSRKTRNFTANPAVSVHLESGDETVIFEGSIAQLTDTALITPIAAAYNRKYFPDNPETDVVTGNPMFYLQPEKVLAWLETDYPRTATRWRFGATGEPLA